MRAIFWTVLGVMVILGTLLGGCQSAKVKTPDQIQGDGNEVEVDQRQQSNSTMALILIPCICVALFLIYLYMSKNYIGFGRR